LNSRLKCAGVRIPPAGADGRHRAVGHAGIVVLATLTVTRGLWGFVSSRWGWSLFPVGYRVRD
jgi:hypothetical protein